MHVDAATDHRPPLDEDVQRVLDRLHDTVKQDLHAAERALGEGELTEVHRHLADAILGVSGILRDGHAGRSGPAALDDAVDSAIVAARRRVDDTVRVVPPDGLPLSPSIAPAVVRLVADTVTEGIHNAARHRPGATLALSIAEVGEAVHLTAATRGGNAMSHHPPGTGLRRLWARAHRLGGNLRTVTTGNGHVLELRLPTTPHPAG